MVNFASQNVDAELYRANTSDPYYTTTSYDVYTSTPVYNPMMFWLWLAVAVVMVVSLWKIFDKAGKPGWAAIVPFYNVWVLLETVGRPGWWIILYLIPLVNIVISIIVAFDLAKVFGKGGAFGFFGLFLFPIVGYPILAFSDAKYKKPAKA